MIETRYENLLNLAAEAAVEAGKAAMFYFKNKHNRISIKSNLSPVTLADKEANRIITEKLVKTGINVISEEAEVPPYRVRKKWDEVWIIDPIDGTKEFIAGGMDFTVNIALVIKKEVKMGVIYIPATGELFYGIKGIGAFKQNIILHEFQKADFMQKSSAISPKKGGDKITVVVSRAHKSMRTKKFINKISKKYSNVEIIRRSSSLKYCLVAEGKADLFLRFYMINEWDTAAGHAIAEASGCTVVRPNTSSPTLYNKKFMISPKNIVACSEEIIVYLS